MGHLAAAAFVGTTPGDLVLSATYEALNRGKSFALRSIQHIVNTELQGAANMALGTFLVGQGVFGCVGEFLDPSRRYTPMRPEAAIEAGQELILIGVFQIIEYPVAAVSTYCLANWAWNYLSS